MEQKIIYSQIRNQFRHDTIRNWETKNPTLLEGEAGVVTGLNEVGDGLEDKTKKIKFGDGIHDWNSLDWWYGCEGNGGSSVEVDQTYNPESENPQSGKAVAEALLGVSGGGSAGQYELIETITIAEEGITSITRNAEPNGTPYSFKDIYISFIWNNGAEKGKWIQLKIWAYDKVAHAFRVYDSIGVNSRSWIKTLYHYGERAFVLSDATTNTSYAKFAAQVPIVTLISDKQIDKIAITHEIEFKAGTQIEIWGVRA